MGNGYSGAGVRLESSIRSGLSAGSDEVGAVVGAPVSQMWQPPATVPALAECTYWLFQPALAMIFALHVTDETVRAHEAQAKTITTEHVL